MVFLRLIYIQKEQASNILPKMARQRKIHILEKKISELTKIFKRIY